MKRNNPAAIAAPAGAYSHTIEMPADARWLHIAGQVGIAPDGSVPDSVAAQSEVVFDNLAACLADAGMGFDDVVKITSFLLDPADMAAFAEVRSARMGSSRPASTLVFVAALVRSEWKIEVEMVAARAD
ncbi:MAG: RidA family protein [Roseicyclus sp.]